MKLQNSYFYLSALHLQSCISNFLGSLYAPFIVTVQTGAHKGSADHLPPALCPSMQPCSKRDVYHQKCPQCLTVASQSPQTWTLDTVQ